MVVVIELGAYIHDGVLTFNGCLLSRFYGMCSIYLYKCLHHNCRCTLPYSFLFRKSIPQRVPIIEISGNVL